MKKAKKYFLFLIFTLQSVQLDNKQPLGGTDEVDEYGVFNEM